MRWWKHLYMGDRAMKNRPNVLRGIREGKVMPDTYVITLPESGNHILDIRPVLLLKKEEREEDKFLILGVASGYGEAAEVVRTMVDDMFRLTGTFDWNAFMRCLDDGDGKAASGECAHCEEAQ